MGREMAEEASVSSLIQRLYHFFLAGVPYPTSKVHTRARTHRHTISLLPVSRALNSIGYSGKSSQAH